MDHLGIRGSPAAGGHAAFLPKGLGKRLAERAVASTWR